jgi:hypothetical protein
MTIRFVLKEVFVAFTAPAFTLPTLIFFLSKSLGLELDFSFLKSRTMRKIYFYL